MTWRWLICSKPQDQSRKTDAAGTLVARGGLRARICVLCLAAGLLPWCAAAGTVGGQVELTNSRDPAIRHHNYSGVVVWLEPVGHPAPSAPARRVEMKQANKVFSPHVVAIPLGGTVAFPNLDPIFHNVFSNFSGQPFDLPLYAPNTTRSVTFTKPGTVQVFCNIHSTMSAIIKVVPTPWYALTPPTGRFTIADVPPGEYELRIFHERALPENLKFLERRITIPEGDMALPLISISETGFTPAEHMDKHGKPYPKAPAESVYSGGGR
jgi:plastocyanin